MTVFSERVEIKKLGLGMAGESVRLLGWVQRRRDLGGLIFVALRDRTAMVQVIFDPEKMREGFAVAERLRSEFVVSISGTVSARPEDMINPDLEKGEIEVLAESVEILSRSQTPPFYIIDQVDVDENLRLKYRYLDLRRPEMQAVFKTRHQVTLIMRNFLNSQGFYEIETPILTKSSPEGARDYLVPSRVRPGEFYALPQSPQIYKQLLMAGGMEKYFQIARCFRDEDLRADRQPEFTQLDIEMSFVEVDDILPIMEQLMAQVFSETIDKKATLPFPRLTYKEAMDRYGSDKPDTRFGMELIDVGDLVGKMGFKVFADTVAGGGSVKCICGKGCSGLSRRELDALGKYVGTYRAKGLAWIVVTEKGVKSPLAKFFTEQEMSALLERACAETGDVVFFIADTYSVVSESLGHLRLELAKRLGLISEDALNFLWVTEFPLLEYDEEQKRYIAIHHPFTAPMDEDLPLMETEPIRVRAKAYDMVLNGTELGGGSIRIHRREIQEKLFNLIGLSEAEAMDKFGYLLEAFEYGTPPHGGIAFGVDRMIMHLTGKDNIRDVIAFPKTQSASDLMVQAPSTVSDEQLQELQIKTLKNV